MGTPSERFDAEIEEDYRKWEEGVRRIEKAVAGKGHRELKKLEKAGIDRKALLTLLALAAHHDASGALPELRRRTHAQLKSLSGRIGTVARETERVVKNPLSAIQFWAYLEGCWGALGMAEPKPLDADPGVTLAVSAMRVLAKRLKEEANLFSIYSRKVGQTDAGIVLLLVRCWIFRTRTGHATHLLGKKGGRVRPTMDCLDELALLLTDAFEAAGKNRVFSPDGLRMTFKRHGRRAIVQWLKFNLPPSKAESTLTFPPVPSPSLAPKTP